ncbi:MAG: NAD(P)/FAD-dependent oxidoreductase [Candidatus Helarchaeota archaeon]
MFDVIVIGAGPAGSTAALNLGKKGFKVLLMDKNKFPRDKPCGGWITPNVLKLLNWNYEETCKNIFVSPIRGLAVYSPSLENFTIKRKEDLSYGIIRSEFDDKIKNEAIECGVKFYENTNFSNIEILQEHVKVNTTNGRFISKILIGADGTNSKVAKLTGIRKPWGSSEKVLDLVSETKVAKKDIENLYPDDLAYIFYNEGGGYNWIYPKICSDKEFSYINIGIGCRLSEMTNSRKMLLNHIKTLRELNLLPRDLKLNKHNAWPYATFNGPKKTYANRLLLIGDAAGFSSNIAGEGIRTGIISGILAAETISEVDNYSSENLKLFRKKWKKILKTEYNIGSILQFVLYKEKDSIDDLINKVKNDEIGQSLLINLLLAKDLEKTFGKLMDRI